jgi:RHS repeat-associated protein
MDVENRPMGTSTTNYFYDHAGKRMLVRYDPYVWPNYPSGAQNTWEYAMYGVSGQRLVTVGCTYDANAKPNCSVSGKNVYFGGKLVVARGVTVATDRLGTVRANSNGESFAYYPYGEERTSTADGREKFGTYVRDNPYQDYADQRYYGVGTGRFNVPDPSTGSSAADPGSWNKYAYVGDDPINFADPSGLARCSVVGSTTTAGDTTVEIQCTSTAGSVFAWQSVTFNGGASQGDINAALKSLGTTVDQAERADFNGLLAASIKRVQADLLKNACAKDYKNAQKTSAKAATAHFADLGPLQLIMQDDRVVPNPSKKAPPDAMYDPIRGIRFNSEVNWASPSNTFGVLVPSGASVMFDLLPGEAYAVGAATMTADQYMDIVLLHELAHYNGAIGDPDNAEVERRIWNDCIR